MSHVSENSRRLQKHITPIASLDQLNASSALSSNVYLFYFPGGRTDNDASHSEQAYEKIQHFCNKLHKNSTVCILTTPSDAARLLPFLEHYLHFKLWIAVKAAPTVYQHRVGKLPENHLALLVLTRYSDALRHTKTRIRYTYCRTCGKTTKDYGGKKHTYHESGTLLSDVWRDIECDPFENIEPVVDRLQDLFGLEEYSHLQVLDMHLCTELLPSEEQLLQTTTALQHETAMPHVLTNSQLLNEDCLTALATLPDNSIDFCFADPPYNLQKHYSHWTDAMELVDYFSWCDKWLSELIRVLKPGRTLAILNIPLWAVRHYQYLASRNDLRFQNWLVWDAMSFPVRLIMPAHYSILCFSKGEPRPLPGLVNNALPKNEKAYLFAQSDAYCIRESCKTRRNRAKVNDRVAVTDTWYDIHRLKHNSRRVDHPCQLPPQLMYRLYALFTEQGETILDCFNGAGTSTLTAQQLQRNYIGIELSPQYHALTVQRHEQLSGGKDPFGKQTEVPQSKNSRVERLPKQRYSVSKKILQLDVKRIAQQLGKLPTRDDVIRMSSYSIDYFDNYFASWGEVCAAARTTGMSELPSDYVEPVVQLSFAYDTTL